MSSLNRATLIGRLGQDPEVRYTPNGAAVTNFSLATSETWKDKDSGEKREKTQWHRIKTWQRLAEICGEYLTKGQRVYIEGRIETREWEDRDGIKRYITEIIATNMVMLDGGRSKQDRPASSPQPQSSYQDQFGPDDDDIPF
jgi:single-strand DNA-binding protein